MSPRRKLSCGIYALVHKRLNVIELKVLFVIKQLNVSHHFFGVLVTKRRLVCDVKDGNGTLSPICEASGTAREQLLRSVLKDIYRVQLRTQNGGTQTVVKLKRVITKTDGLLGHRKWCFKCMVVKHFLFQI